MKYNIVPLCLVITFAILFVSVVFVSTAYARTCPDYNCLSGTACGPDCCTHSCNKSRYPCYKYDVVQNNTDDGTSCSGGADCKVGDICLALECNRYNATGNSVCRSPPGVITNITGCPATSEYVKLAASSNCYYWCPVELIGTSVWSDSPCTQAPVDNKCKFGQRVSAIYECYDWSAGTCSNVTGNGDTCTIIDDCDVIDCYDDKGYIDFDCDGGFCKYGVPSGDTVTCVSGASAAGKCASLGHVSTTNKVKKHCWNCCKEPCDGVTCPNKCENNIVKSAGACFVPGQCIFSNSEDCDLKDGCYGSTYRQYYCDGGSATCEYTSITCDSILTCDNGNPTASIAGAPAAWQNTDATGTVACTDSEGCCDSSSYAYKIYFSDPGVCPATGYTSGNTFTIDKHAWVCGYVEDKAGNKDTSSPVEFKVDKVKPDISCSDCYLPEEVIGGEDVLFVPVLNDTYSGINTIRICNTADCDKLVYCANGTNTPAGTPVVRSCAYLTAECIYSENDFYVEAVDLAGNREVVDGGNFITLLCDGCECYDSEDCEDRECIAGKCLVPQSPEVVFSPEATTVELGDNVQKTITLKNNIAAEDTVKLTIDTYPEKIFYWTEFDNGDNEIDVRLEPYEEKVIYLDIFAGEVGTYKVTIIAESTLVPTLYSKDEETIQVVQKGHNEVSRTPGLNMIPLMFLIIAASVMYATRKH